MTKVKTSQTKTGDFLPIILTGPSFNAGLGYLSDCDSDLARILDELGKPPLWLREPGFPTLLYIILEQQVSLASAKAAYDRLLIAVSPLTPPAFLELDDITLKKIGFSRQKTAYGRHLAKAIVTDRLNLESLTESDDATVRIKLTDIKGIGPWTANIYLLMALRRPDIWPGSDLALAEAVKQVKRLSVRPSPAELETIAAVWRPWRAIAARILWHYYLSQRVSKR